MKNFALGLAIGFMLTSILNLTNINIHVASIDDSLMVIANKYIENKE